MSAFRSLCAAVASAVTTFLVVHSSGCGTDAVGVDECRKIEEARCEAGVPCGVVDDADACKRFYRDQCLHGMQNAEKPGDPAVNKCIATIKAAGRCAAAEVENLADCPEPPTAGTTLTKVCDVVLEPELVVECDFLVEPVVLPEAGPEAAPDVVDDGATSDVATE